MSQDELAKIGQDTLNKQALQKKKDKWYLSKANHIKREMERLIKENELEDQIVEFDEPMPTE